MSSEDDFSDSAQERSSAKRMARERAPKVRAPLTPRRIFTQIVRSLLREDGIVHMGSVNKFAKFAWQELRTPEMVETLSLMLPPRDESQQAKRKLRNKRRAPKGAPRRPAGAYLFFARDARPTLPKMGFKETAVELGKLWAALPQEERGKYVALADADKARYKNEFAAWKATESSSQPHSRRKKARSS